MWTSANHGHGALIFDVLTMRKSKALKEINVHLADALHEVVHGVDLVLIPIDCQS